MHKIKTMSEAKKYIKNIIEKQFMQEMFAINTLIVYMIPSKINLV